MIKDDCAIIVDYKLEHEVAGKYVKQISGYCQELKKTGFAKVEGFLWYLVPDKIEKVCEF